MRALLPFVALVLASVLGIASLTAYVAHETALDPDRAGEVMAGALDESRLRDQLLTRTLPGYTSLPSEYREDVNRLADSPGVSRALSEVRVDDRGRADLAPVRRELAVNLREGGYGELAAQVSAADGRDTVHLPPQVWRSYTQAREVAWLVATAGAAAAAALFLAGVLVARNRRRALGVVGVALLLSAGAAVLLLRSLPALAAAVSSDPAVETAAALGSPALATMAPMLLPVAVVGAVLLAVPLLLPSRHPRPGY